MEDLQQKLSERSSGLMVAMCEAAAPATSRKSSPAQDAAFLGQRNHHWAATAVGEMSDPVTSVAHIAHRGTVTMATAACQVAPCRLAGVLEVGKVGMADLLDG